MNAMAYKKFLIVAGVAAMLIACGDSSSNSTEQEPEMERISSSSEDEIESSSAERAPSSSSGISLRPNQVLSLNLQARSLSQARKHRQNRPAVLNLPKYLPVVNLRAVPITLNPAAANPCRLPLKSYLRTGANMTMPPKRLRIFVMDGFTGR